MEPVEKDQVWILEDEQTAQLIYEQLLGARYQIRMLAQLAGLKTALQATSPDLLLADLRLPDGSFVDFLAHGGREQLEGIPFIVVSSVDDEKTLHDCFANGTHDYLTKPTGHNELLFKIERVLQESKAKSVMKNLVIDDQALKIANENGRTATLTAKEFQIVGVLQQSRHLRATRTNLMDKIWGTDTPSSKTLDVHMHNLRRKIQPLGLHIIYRRPSEYQLIRRD